MTVKFGCYKIHWIFVCYNLDTVITVKVSGSNKVAIWDLNMCSFRVINSLEPCSSQPSMTVFCRSSKSIKTHLSKNFFIAMESQNDFFVEQKRKQSTKVKRVGSGSMSALGARPRSKGTKRQTTSSSATAATSGTFNPNRTRTHDKSLSGTTMLRSRKTRT